MREVIQSATLSIALPCGINQRQIARLLLRKKPSLECGRKGFRMSRADEATAGYGHPALNMHNGFVGRTPFRFERRTHRHPMFGVYLVHARVGALGSRNTDARFDVATCAA